MTQKAAQKHNVRVIQCAYLMAGRDSDSTDSIGGFIVDHIGDSTGDPTDHSTDDSNGDALHLLHRRQHQEAEPFLGNYSMEIETLHPITMIGWRSAPDRTW